jgi:hypothetical protein
MVHFNREVVRSRSDSLKSKVAIVIGDRIDSLGLSLEVNDGLGYGRARTIMEESLPDGWSCILRQKLRRG